MNSNVIVRLGNLFDGPSDLIVLPCSTSGTVTGFVSRSLVHYSIPFPREGMKLGEVEILPFEGAENIAQYVAFAASVRGDSSSFEEIRSIGCALGEFTKEQTSVRSIASPLLGAGAGGIQSDRVVKALKEGFISTAALDSTLIIHVLHEDIFKRLKENRKGLKGAHQETVRVFISHTSQTPKSVEWVKQLALFLIDNGIQARLDHFHLRRGMDLPQWMTNELALAQKVVIVCDEAYKQRADGRMGGVGWETMIIQGDIANQPSDSTKYQIIVRTESMRDGLPDYLRTRFVFHAPISDNSESYRSGLLRELLDLPLDERLEAKEFVI